MSSGWSVSDVLGLGQLAFKVIQNSRKACGEHDELTREVTALHVVLQRLEREISKSNSPVNRPGDSSAEELEALAQDCRKVLRVLSIILDKYNALGEEERRGRKLWQKIRFGNGEMNDLADLRSKVLFNTSAITFYLNIVNTDILGRVEEQINTTGGVIKEIQVAINKITIQASSEGNREGSVLTTYSNDDKAVWKEFRRELIHQGFLSSDLQDHKNVIQAYVKELGSRGLLDDEIPVLSDIEEADINAEDKVIMDDMAIGCSAQPLKALTTRLEDTLLGDKQMSQKFLNDGKVHRCTSCNLRISRLEGDFICAIEMCQFTMCDLCQTSACRTAVQGSEYKPITCPCGQKCLPSTYPNQTLLTKKFREDYNQKLKIFSFASERQIFCRNTYCGQRIPVENIKVRKARRYGWFGVNRGLFVVGTCLDCQEKTCCLCSETSPVEDASDAFCVTNAFFDLSIPEDPKLRNDN